MPTKQDLLNALEEVFEIAESDDGDLDQVGQVAAETLGYDWPPESEEEDDIEIDSD